MPFEPTDPVQPLRDKPRRPSQIVKAIGEAGAPASDRKHVESFNLLIPILMVGGIYWTLHALASWKVPQLIIVKKKIDQVHSRSKKDRPGAF